MLVTTTFERVLHLVLFVAAAVAFAILGLSLIERLVTGSKDLTLRTRHVAVAMGAFLVLFAAERVYHLVH